jgi:hypothetical protein
MQKFRFSKKDIKNFMNAIISFIKGVSHSVSKEVYSYRLKQCSKCNYKSKTWMCTSCNCFIPLKANFSAEHCPIFRWNKVMEKDEIGRSKWEHSSCGGCRNAK